MLGDFNARVGRADTEGGRVGQSNFGEETRNPRDNQLLEFLETTDLFALNGRRAGMPQWTREMGAQRSIIDYILANADCLASNWRGERFHIIPQEPELSDHNVLLLDLVTWAGARQRRRRRRRKQPVFRWRLDRLLEGPPEQRAAVQQRAAGSGACVSGRNAAPGQRRLNPRPGRGWGCSSVAGCGQGGGAPARRAPHAHPRPRGVVVGRGDRVSRQTAPQHVREVAGNGPLQRGATGPIPPAAQRL